LTVAADLGIGIDGEGTEAGAVGIGVHLHSGRVDTALPGRLPDPMAVLGKTALCSEP